jgi:hypothetical protein
MADEGDRVLDLAEEILRSTGRQPTREDDGSTVQTVLTGEEGETLLTCLVEIDRAGLRCVVTAHPADRVPAERRGAVAEYFTRMNYAMQPCWFAIDLDDGAMLARAAISFRGGSVPRPLLENAIGEVVAAIDAYSQPLAAVIEGRMTPEQAYQAS